jgi:hypothetical protein
MNSWDATLYGYSLYEYRKRLAPTTTAYTDSRTGTGFGGTDDSDNVDSIFVVHTWLA